MVHQNWEIFESIVYNFLKTYFKKFKEINFQRKGGKNSNEPDIKVIINGIHQYNIEVKLSPAQSGQVVIEKKGKYFFESEKGKFKNIFTEELLTFVNNNLNVDEVKQSGIKIECPQNLLNNWIKEHYKSKKSRFIITSSSLNDSFTIVDVNDLEKYFICSAVIRRKKSGSRNISKSKLDEVLHDINFHLQSIEIQMKNYYVKDEKLYVTTESFTEIENSQRYFKNKEYFLSLNEPPSTYVVKSLSKTNNINIVFGLTLREDIKPSITIEFQKLLNH